MTNSKKPPSVPKKDRKAATLKDVAKRAGVHTSTVSRVMNSAQRKMVSDSVAERVKKIATEMGYTANPFGYGLRTKKSNTIGVVVPDLTNPVFPPMMRGVGHTLREFGYTTILADSNESVETEKEIVDQMQLQQVEGLILASAHRADRIVEEALHQGLPLVLINRSTEKDGVVSVTNDDCHGAKLAVNHLIEMGHTKIAHLAGPRFLSTGNNRRNGYLAALKKNKIRVNAKLTVTCNAFGIRDGVKGFHKLYKKGEPFTAIFAGNDAIALGCYQAIAELGLSCPDDISIIGYNDMPLVNLMQPRLSSVRIDLYEMGSRAANALVELIQDQDTYPEPATLEPKLVIRDSVADIRKKK